jgi:hypothetical protein
VVSNSFSLVSPTNVTLTITNHATLTWLWTTNYWLATATNGPGTVSAASGWTALGSNVTLTAVPLAASWFMNWSGNTSGCSIAGTQIVGPMTASRSIQANFKANAAPTAATGGPYAVTVGQNLALNGSGSSDADAAYGDSLVAYEWDVDNDGQFNDATGASPTLTWAQLQGLGLGTPGLYTVRLRVTDTLGAVGVGSTSLTVAALASGITVLGVNGAAVANGEAASVPKGTDFGTRTVGASVTNTFAITNSGTATLSISGVTTSGTGAAHFRVLGMPATVVAGAASNFWIVFSPGVTGVQAAAVSIANNSTNTPYVVNVSGTGRLVTGGIDPTNKYAWSSHTGWQNWAPTHGGVTVVNAGANGYLTGFVWTENAGWIKLGAGPGPYANTGAGDWGVNMDASGNLSGYAWSSHVGWINFHPTHGQVTVDTGTGRFDGFAWGENIGWIHFKNASPAYNVRTTVFDLLSSVWSGSGFTFK